MIPSDINKCDMLWIFEEIKLIINGITKFKWITSDTVHIEWMQIEKTIWMHIYIIKLRVSSQGHNKMNWNKGLAHYVIYGGYLPKGKHKIREYIHCDKKVS